MSVTGAVQRYFLRIYAEESRKPRRSSTWGPFGEAMFQTFLLAFLPIVGMGSAALILLPYKHFLITNRSALTAVFVLISLTTSYVFVRRAVGDPALLPAQAKNFGSTRDRVKSNALFWCVLIGSLALPWLAAGLKKLLE